MTLHLFLLRVAYVGIALSSDVLHNSVNTFQRPGAQVLYMEWPMQDGFFHAKAPRFALVPGLKLDATRPVRMWVAFYSTANISWMGAPLQSEMQSVPHHELSVQLPVRYKGKSFYHCVYSLTDDDVAMLHYRDVQGAPAKLADFEFADDTEGPARFNVVRRKEVVLSIAGGLGRAVDANLSELQGLFDNTLNIFGTQALMPRYIPFYGKEPSNSVFLSLRSSTRIIRAWEFDVDTVSIPLSPHEPIFSLFAKGSTQPLKALWLHADIGAMSDPVPVIVGPVSPWNPMDLKYFVDTFLLKLGGAPIKAGVPAKRGNPFEWQNGRFIWLSVKVKPEMAQKQLPPGATLVDDTAHIFCASYPTALLMGSLPNREIAKDNYPYHEFGIRLKAKFPGGVYHHVTYILVDDDVALMTGRDMLGTPKKMSSKFEFPEEDLQSGSLVNFYIERRGQAVINFTGRIGSDTPDKPAPGLTDEFLDVSVYSNAIPTYFTDDMPAGVQGPQFVQWFASHNVLENKAMENSHVSFGSSVFEPLADWLVDGKPLDAGFLRMDYSKPNDLRSRPTIGAMPLGEAAVEYWRNNYQSHHGGAPLSTHAPFLV